MLISFVLYAGVGLISIILFWFSRKQREYLWAGVALVGWGLLAAANMAGRAQQSVFPYQLSIAIQMAAGSIVSFAMPMAAMYLLAVPSLKWRRASFLTCLVNVILGVESLGMILGYLPANAIFERIDAVLWWALPKASLNSAETRGCRCCRESSSAPAGSSSS